MLQVTKKSKRLFISLAWMLLLAAACSRTGAQPAATPSEISSAAVEVTPTAVVVPEATAEPQTVEKNEPDPAAAEGQLKLYGVPPQGEGILDLSGSWRAQTAPRLQNEMTQPDFDDSGWTEVEVPARWSEQGIEPAPAIIPPVTIYRRTFEAPAGWQSQPIGIAAWLMPGHSTVTLNGERLEPVGEAPWLYADVTGLLNPEGDNVLAVTTQFDGIYETAIPAPPRIGPLGEWVLPAVREDGITLEINGQSLEAILYTAAENGAALRPGVLMLGTGSHGLAFTEPFMPLARELAYAGYAALPLGLEAQTVENIDQALTALRNLPGVDSQRIAVIGAVESADGALDQAAGDNAPLAIVTLSAKNTDLPGNLNLPVLLIAPERDSLGPTSVFAERIAEQLGPPSTSLVLPGSGSGLSLLDSHWNVVRAEVLAWLDAYLR